MNKLVLTFGDIKVKIPNNILCNCGHTRAQHFLTEGCCEKCGCTWYWPNDKYILKLQKKYLNIRK